MLLQPSHLVTSGSSGGGGSEGGGSEGGGSGGAGGDVGDVNFVDISKRLMDMP